MENQKRNKRKSFTPQKIFGGSKEKIMKSTNHTSFNSNLEVSDNHEALDPTAVSIEVQADILSISKLNSQCNVQNSDDVKDYTYDKGNVCSNLIQNFASLSKNNNNLSVSSENLEKYNTTSKGLLAHVQRCLKEGDPRSAVCDLCDRRLLGQHALQMHMHAAHGCPRPWSLLLPDLDAQSTSIESDTATESSFRSLQLMLSRYQLQQQSFENVSLVDCSQDPRVISSASLSSLESPISDQEQPLDLSLTSPTMDIDSSIDKMAARSRLKRIAENAALLAREGKSICKRCGLRCGTEAAMLEHMRKTHNNNTVSLPDPLFLRRSPEEKKFTCDVCDQTFKRRDHLNIHMQRHTGIVPHRCDVCDRGFGTVYKLNRHMRSHTKEKPYQCEICLKRFPYDNTYKRHLRLHSGEKGHRCTICALAFYRPDALKVHMEKKHGVYQSTARSRARLANLKREGEVKLEFPSPFKIEAKMPASTELETKCFSNETTSSPLHGSAIAVDVKP